MSHTKDGGQPVSELPHRTVAEQAAGIQGGGRDVGVVRAIVIDCRGAPTLARFWASLLDGYAVRA